ncbi:hypothetical protein [Streptobacillus moniliformis]|uniref:hypothetical protein n=1 Tax=Streptobacillus moniliformis TaxID=34105 RepID=UPI0007E45EAF|nr:hypothetical protein [Streptobacillus moniliformis]
MNISQLPNALVLRLKKYRYTTEDISINISTYENQGNDYLILQLGAELYNKLSIQQKELLIINYIQYQLFAMVEMESLVRDKKEFIDNIIDKLIQTNIYEKEQRNERNKQTRGIKVF